jgi:hypothetical protein
VLCVGVLGHGWQQQQQQQAAVLQVVHGVQWFAVVCECCGVAYASALVSVTLPTRLKTVGCCLLMSDCLRRSAFELQQAQWIEACGILGLQVGILQQTCHNVS